MTPAETRHLLLLVGSDVGSVVDSVVAVGVAAGVTFNMTPQYASAAGLDAVAGALNAIRLDDAREQRRGLPPEQPTARAQLNVNPRGSEGRRRHSPI